jgi:hypothetical protein
VSFEPASVERPTNDRDDYRSADGVQRDGRDDERDRCTERCGVSIREAELEEKAADRAELGGRDLREGSRDP